MSPYVCAKVQHEVRVCEKELHCKRRHTYIVIAVVVIIIVILVVVIAILVLVIIFIFISITIITTCIHTFIDTFL